MGDMYLSKNVLKEMFNEMFSFQTRFKMQTETKSGLKDHTYQQQKTCLFLG